MTGCSTTAAAALTPCIPNRGPIAVSRAGGRAEVAELLISIKTEHQSWSVRQVIAGAVASGHLPDGVRPAHSTVHRLLRAEGLMSKPTAASDGTDRRRFSYRFAGQLWMSDVMHGPSGAVFVSSGGQFRVSPNTRRRQPNQRSRGGHRAHADLARRRATSPRAAASRLM